MNVVGVLLAAGSSTRFGSDKRWHPLADGTPMALEAARRLAAACPETIAVLRADDDPALAALLATAGVRCLQGADAALGMGHSLAAGVTATPGADGWLVALADMPFIAAGSYAAVLARLAEGARIARPAWSGHMGHPVGFATTCRDDLLALTGDAGGRSLIARDPSALTVCPVDDPGVVHDVDRRRNF